MTKTISIVVAALVVAAGFLLWQRDHDGAGSMTNGEMLRDDSAAQIATESDVAYVEGAKGYFARPEADGDYPGVVLIHENRGLRQEIRDTAGSSRRRTRRGP